MKVGNVFAASLLAVASTATTLRPNLDVSDKQQPIKDSTAEDLFLVELEPGRTEWITEERKWELKRVSSLNRYEIPRRSHLEHESQRYGQ